MFISNLGVASAYEVSRLESFPCDNNREQKPAKGNSNHPSICGTTCIDKIWLYLELSSYASLNCG